MKFATSDNLAGCTSVYSAMLETEFAAPVLRGRPVVVAINDDCHRVQIVPPMFQGWAVARLISPRTAIVIRDADATERETLLKQWPEVALQVCHVSSLGVLAVRQPDGAAASVSRVHLCDDAVIEDDVVAARFDGRQYWFDRIVARGAGRTLGRFASSSHVLPDLYAATFAISFPFDEPVH